MESGSCADTPSKAALTSDGHQWKKYGRKTVKGNVHPRCYYKCRYPGCDVKKTMETQLVGAKLVTNVSYTGEHNHPAPQLSRATARDHAEFQALVKEYTSVVRASERMNARMRKRANERGHWQVDG